MNIIQQIEQEEIERLNKINRKDFSSFHPGDTVSVWVRFQEGNRVRSQAFEGIVIGKRSRGLNSSFIVRKISNGEGVEERSNFMPLMLKRSK